MDGPTIGQEPPFFALRITHVDDVIRLYNPWVYEKKFRNKEHSIILNLFIVVISLWIPLGPCQTCRLIQAHAYNLGKEKLHEPAISITHSNGSGRDFRYL